MNFSNIILRGITFLVIPLFLSCTTSKVNLNYTKAARAIEAAKEAGASSSRGEAASLYYQAKKQFDEIEYLMKYGSYDWDTLEEKLVQVIELAEKSEDKAIIEKN